MTDSRLRLAAQAVVDDACPEEYGVLRVDEGLVDALRRALAKPAESSGYDAGMLDGHRLGFRDGVEASILATGKFPGSGALRDELNALVPLAPPVPREDAQPAATGDAVPSDVPVCKECGGRGWNWTPMGEGHEPAKYPCLTCGPDHGPSQEKP